MPNCKITHCYDNINDSPCCHCGWIIQLYSPGGPTSHIYPISSYLRVNPNPRSQNGYFIGPFLWGHSGPLCHALSLALWTSILHCHSPGVATVACRLCYSYSWLRLILVVVSTVATPGEWAQHFSNASCWFSNFCMVKLCDQQTDRQTRSVARPHI